MPVTRWARPPALALIYGPALAVLAVTALAHACASVSPAFFARDPAATFAGHPLTGMQSHLGVLAWCATAAVCLFGSAVLRRLPGDGTSPAFALWGGVFTLILTLDDLFLVHDDLVDRYFGLSDKVVLAGYALFFLWYTVRFRRVILDSEYALLAAAVAFFGAALVVDAVQERWLSPWRIFVEDGFKLLGIVTWSGYFIRWCLGAVMAARPAGVDPGPGATR